jgi:hypothetical protein
MILTRIGLGLTFFTALTGNLVPGGSAVLRAPTQLLGSRSNLSDLEAVANAPSGRRIPPVATIQESKETELITHQMMAGPDGCTLQRARQQLPLEQEKSSASVAVASARGGACTHPAQITDSARRLTQPVLAFPEPGLDDTAAYQGYQTRFYRDSKGNTVQIYLQPRGGRAVLVWADAANESAGFTVRDAGGRPADLEWGAVSASISDSAATRTLEYQITAPTSKIMIGWFVLGSMRVERDFVYANRHLQPFTAPPFRVAEESLLVAAVRRLPSPERQSHLSLLRAESISELEARLLPTITSSHTDTSTSVRVERPSLDGRNHLVVELRVDPRRIKSHVSGRSVELRTRPGSPVRFSVKISTDAAPLIPLTREKIFNRTFLDFLGQGGTGDDSATAAHRRLERQVRGVELLSSEEKLMAGLPNFATYFGRDMMMTALMMRPIWLPEMSEHVIASVLRKLGPKGDVSHEEALGGQAIREYAVIYDSLITQYGRALKRHQEEKAGQLLQQAKEVLRDLQKTRENYHMIDDEFQLPVLAARYLADSTVPTARKRTFLLEKSERGESRIALLLKELALVASLVQPYAQAPRATNLVSFPKRDSVHWRSASWRDSDAGYAGGRFAMDINVIWAPKALESMATILDALATLGIEQQTYDSMAAAMSRTALGGYLRNRAELQQAIQVWKGARKHFTVTLSPSKIRRAVDAKLSWLPASERTYWREVMRQHDEIRDSLTFLVLSLDQAGHPIRIVNTDPATELFLGTSAPADSVAAELEPFLRAYPVGLFVTGLGPVVANDAYASRAIWDRFQADQYHSPRVVWGREVNLLLIGIANQVKGGSRPEFRDALRTTLGAVNASGLQHNELWSYQIKGGKLIPVRYGTSSDVQLWNTTSLVVQYTLAHLK